MATNDYTDNTLHHSGTSATELEGVHDAVAKRQHRRPSVIELQVAPPFRSFERFQNRHQFNQFLTVFIIGIMTSVMVFAFGVVIVQILYYVFY